MGFILHLVTLGILTELADVHYLWATVFAVEVAILHNFLWHERWTWKDRPTTEARTLAARLIKFNSTSGLISIFGNTALMSVYVGQLGFAPMPANVLTVASCSLVNFIVNDRLVFSAHRRESLTDDMEVPGERHVRSAGCC